ncbi:MAG: hypothetical protein WDM87_15375 [Terracidiphilus sp.]
MGKSIALGVEARHAGEIDGAEDIDIMNEEGFVFVRAVLQEEPCSLLEAASGIEQNIFAGDLNAHAEVTICSEVVNDTVGEVVHIDNHFIHAEMTAAAEE